MSEQTPVTKNHEDDKPWPKEAYITAPPNVDTRPIRRALEAKGVRAFSPDQLDLPGMLLSDVLRAAMKRADILVAVIDPTSSSNFVFYEMGYAKGIGKPAFLFLADDASPSVWMSSGTPYFKFNPENTLALEFAVQQILAIPHHGVEPTPTAAKRSRPIGDRADELLAQLRAGGEEVKTDVFEEVIGRAIRESGVTSIERGGGGRGVDFVVWSEDLSPWVGNPLAIELPTRIRGMADITASRLSKDTEGRQHP